MMNEIKPYKINVGDVVEIEKQEVREYTFYKIKLTKKDKDGKTIYGKKNIRFTDGKSVENGTKIRILDMFEDFYIKGYDTIFTLVIKGFEEVNNESEIPDFDQAIDEYNQEIEMNFDLNGGDF